MGFCKSVCKNVSQFADYCNCRMMPHGGIILFPVTLATMGWIASLANDGCDLARLTGPAVIILLGTNTIPFVDIGTTGFRIPEFYPEDNAWRVLYSEQCVPYRDPYAITDEYWTASKWLYFLSVVLGGTSTLFLWSSTCITLRPVSWRTAGVGIFLACACHAGSLIWFNTGLCHLTESSSCTTFFGSKCTITASCLWFVAAIIILFAEYPTPKPKLVVVKEEETTPVVLPPLGARSHAGSGKSTRSGGGDDKSTGQYRGEVLDGTMNRSTRASQLAQSFSNNPDTGKSFNARQNKSTMGQSFNSNSRQSALGQSFNSRQTRQSALGLSFKSQQSGQSFKSQQSGQSFQSRQTRQSALGQSFNSRQSKSTMGQSFSSRPSEYAESQGQDDGDESQFFV